MAVSKVDPNSDALIGPLDGWPGGRMPPDLHVTLTTCLKRICSWRTPPNWSAGDWFEEMKSQAAAMTWQAQCTFDPTRGVPLAAFVHQRVVAAAFTRYRQEWAYALHCITQADDNEAENSLGGSRAAQAITEDPREAYGVFDWLRTAFGCLDKGHRRLIEQLFWEGCSQCEIAQELSISQRAVSKRKQRALDDLRRILGRSA